MYVCYWLPFLEIIRLSTFWQFWAKNQARVKSNTIRLRNSSIRCMSYLSCHWLLHTCTEYNYLFNSMFPNETTDEHEWMVFYSKLPFKLSRQYRVQLEYFHSRWIQDLPYLPGVWAWRMWKQLYMWLCWSKSLYDIKITVSVYFLWTRTGYLDKQWVSHNIELIFPLKKLRCCSTIVCISMASAQDVQLRTTEALFLCHQGIAEIWGSSLSWE